MAFLYSHRQFGKAVFGITIGVALLVLVIVLLVGSSAKPSERGAPIMLTAVVPGLLVVALLLIFSSLEVRVTDTELRWAFGAGFPSYSVRVADITRAEAVNTNLLMGIGIRITPRGWLYNVGTGRAIAVTTGRKTVLIGTDDPDGLLAAIAAARRKPASTP